jgi:hypothetical protein
MCAYKDSYEVIEVNVDVIGGAPELRVTGLAVTVTIPGVVFSREVFCGVGVGVSSGVVVCCGVCDVGRF